MNERQRAAPGIVAEVSDRPVEEIRADTDLGIDSPRALRLPVELQERFGPVIDDHEVAAMDRVSDVPAALA